MSFAYLRSSFPPTCVTHCLAAFFLKAPDTKARGGDDPDLIVIRTNVIEVYSYVNNPVNATNAETDGFIFSKSIKNLPPLRLRLQEDVFGTVASISAFPLPSGREGLLIVFTDEKLSIVDYFHGSNSLRTLYFSDLSIHTKSTPETLNGLRIASLRKLGLGVEFPILRADPLQRCFAVLVDDVTLVVLQPVGAATDDKEEEELFVSKRGISMLAGSATASSSHATGKNKAGTLPEVVTKTWVIDLGSASLNMKNLKDFTFLHEYSEPTIVFLFEPIRTATQLLWHRKNTCCTKAVSLYFSKEETTVISSAVHLPYNAHRIISVRGPFGGALIISSNSILYFNREVLYGLALNDFALKDSDPPVDFDKTLLIAAAGSSSSAVTMDASHMCGLSPFEFLVSLKGGELYILRLEGSGKLSGMLFSRVGASCLASSVTLLQRDEGGASGLVFLGSRYGDSLLVRYVDNLCGSAKKARKFGVEVDSERNRKRRKMEEDEYDLFFGGGGAIRDTAVDDADELQYEDGNDDHALFAANTTDFGKSAIDYKFSVLDTLINVGPIGDMAVGRSSGDSAETTPNSRRLLDLVTCSGYGKNGALCVLQENVRPEEILPFELGDSACMSIWTVHSSRREAVKARLFEDENENKNENRDDNVIENGNGDENESVVEGGIEESGAKPKDVSDPDDVLPVLESEFDESWHSYLVLSLEDSTMILSCGTEIVEIEHDKTGFFTNGPTYNVGNVIGRHRIVQVYEDGVRLLDGIELVEEVLCDVHDTGVCINFSCICDPFVLLLLSDGSVEVLTANMDVGKACLRRNRIDELSGTGNRRITAVNLYKAPLCEDSFWRPIVANAAIFKDSLPLYLYLCVVCRLDSSFELYSFFDDDKGERLIFTCLFRSSGITSGRHLVSDHRDAIALGSSCLAPSSVVLHDVLVIEIIIFSPAEMSSPSSPPSMFALLSTGDVLAYSIFSAAHNVSHRVGEGISKSGTYLPIRFQRHRLPPGMMDTKREGTPALSLSPFSQLIRFDNVGGKRGVFICGRQPGWAMLERDYIRFHPMCLESDGGALCFAQFHSSSCDFGFVYLNSRGTIKICNLPVDGIHYDSAWIVKKIPIRATPHKIAYDAATGFYVVLVSEPSKLSMAEEREKQMTLLEPPTDSEEATRPDIDREHLLGMANDDPTVVQKDPQPEDSLYLPSIYSNKFSMRLYSSQGWQLLDIFKFKKNEHAVAIQSVHLFITKAPPRTRVDRLQFYKRQKAEKQTSRRPYISVGTVYVQGEDGTCRGRLLVFEVDKQVGEGGLENGQIRLVNDKEQKGPVTALVHMDGYLLASVGPKLIIFRWELTSGAPDLVHTSFFDSSFMAISLNAIDNYVLVGDAFSGIRFFSWREGENHSLVSLGKDASPLETTASEFLIEGKEMGYVVADISGRIQIFNYSTQFTKTVGLKFLPRAAFNVGSVVSRLLRLRAQPLTSQPTNDRFLDIFGTHEGAIGHLSPVDEVTYRRLQALQVKMISGLPVVAAMNPKIYRSGNGILDGQLLIKFLFLDCGLQDEFARQVGTTSPQILRDLLSIEHRSAFL